MTQVGAIVSDSERPDLGGNVHGGDPASFVPSVWAELVERFSVFDVLDVGCGEGHAVEWFESHGCVVAGIDGLPANIAEGRRRHLDVYHHDLLTGPYIVPVDLVWCCEVVEHIDESKVDNVLATLANGCVVAMTHATPNQAGYHHVNNQPAEYWIERMVALGYRHDWDETAKWRAIAQGDRDGDNYFRRTGLVFVK